MENIETVIDNTQAKIVVIGTGFSGIAAAVRLMQEGERDIIMLERGSNVGGVWRDNRYPGCACDVESHLYSLSFAPNPGWSKKFSPQSEIFAYLQDCAKKFGLMDYIRVHHEVIRMDWEEANAEWQIQTNQGEFKARFVIGAFGALSSPSIPQLKGIEKFDGQVFHSADWPENFNPKGKRIAVVGTGASAIQFIPYIQPEAEFLQVFQRTPAWVIPRNDGSISRRMQKAYARLPALQQLTRFKIYIQREALVLGLKNPKWLKPVEKLALKHLHKTIRNPGLRKKLTPNYKIGCKRILLSNTYYPALAQPNVAVNTTGISEVTEDSVIDALGNKTRIDAIIFGTGFRVTELPFAHHIYGRARRSLSDEWQGSPKAFMGTAVAGYPNLFILQGPNTGLGHTSVILMIEAQMDYIIKILQYMKQHKLKTIEPSTVAQDRFIAETDKKMYGTVWTSGGCKSWYLDETGRNSTLWPNFTFSFMKKVSKFNHKDYIGS